MSTMLIKNDDQYKKYLREIHDLMGLDPDIDTPEGERLLLLTLAIKEYEDKLFFFEKPTPIEAIRFRMEEQGLIQNDLIPYIGSKSKVSEILSGKRNLTIPMIRALNQHLGIPLDSLIQESQNESFEIRLDNIDWNKLPILEMEKRHWVKCTTSEYNIDYKETVADFLKPLGWLRPQDLRWRCSLHCRGESNSNTYDLVAWIVRVMILADKIQVNDYDESLVTAEYLRELTKLSQFDQGPLLAKEMLEKNGIKLVFLKQLPKSKVDGGCFLDKDGHPVIGMTLRYDRLDSFWYTLLHEMAHIYKHLNNQNQYIDNLDADTKEDPHEKEADKISRESFIPRAIWKSEAFSLQTDTAVHDLAKKLSIHPAIVAGRIRFETNDNTKFSNLIGKGQLKKILKGCIYE